MNNGFTAYENKDEAKRVLRYYHDRGMEGHLTELTQKNESLKLYGIMVLWPEDWSEDQIFEFVDEMHKVTRNID